MHAFRSILLALSYPSVKYIHTHNEMYIMLLFLEVTRISVDFPEATQQNEELLVKPLLHWV